MSFLALAGVVALAATGPAFAFDGRYAARPPVVLSPDVSDGWMLQIRPNYRGAVMQPPVRMPPQQRAWGGEADRPTVIPPIQQAALDPQEVRRPKHQIDPRFLPQLVEYDRRHRPGTIVIDTNARYLYLVEDNGQARRYGIGVGRPGFTWAGRKSVTRKAEWPSWRPPAEMLKRQPHLPRFMAGGPENPLGARALYLGSSLYRIHGTNEPWTIGSAVSSGCIRMRNEDVTDLYDRVRVGAAVIVM